MKERPILFSAPMVRAILDDRKTQTRRTVSGANLDALSRLESELGKPTSSDEWGVCFDNDGIGGVVSVPLPCKHGAIGDRLWVRETWRMSAGRSQEPIYAADLGDYDRDEKGPWRPSIFMPRKLSRITLEITAVRVQRLQEIGADDVVAEGLGPDDIRCDGECGATPCALAVPAFKRLWDLINGRDGRRWSDNPFVWALSFRRVETK